MTEPFRHARRGAALVIGGALAVLAQTAVNMMAPLGPRGGGSVRHREYYMGTRVLPSEARFANMSSSMLPSQHWYGASRRGALPSQGSFSYLTGSTISFSSAQARASRRPAYGTLRYRPSGPPTQIPSLSSLRSTAPYLARPYASSGLRTLHEPTRLPSTTLYGRSQLRAGSTYGSGTGSLMSYGSGTLRSPLR